MHTSFKCITFVENRKMDIKHIPILVVSATEAECAPTLRKMTDCKLILPSLYSGTLHEQPIEVLVSGIGSVAMTFCLTQTLMQRSYRRAISIGIAGSFSEDIMIGETVQIVEDCFADLGIDDNGQFRTLREEGITCDDFDCDIIINPFPIITPHRKLRGVTVQTTSGSQKRIDEIVGRRQPQVETMENAAFFYVCRKLKIPFASFRAISNRVEPRNRKKWQIAEAIEQINNILESLFY